MEPILARQDLRWPFWHLGYLEINPLVSVSYEMHLRVKEKRGRQERKKEVGNGLKKIFFLNFVLVYLRIPWTGRRLNQSNIKKISPEYSLEGLMLKLTWCEQLIHWKRPWCGERWKAGGKWDDRGWDGLTTSMDMSLSKLQELVIYREAWRAWSQSQTQLSNWTELNSKVLF